jgi:NAD(P)-dependent dehydrogenase (short-subunit alcohol dehydrogenase family)
MRRRGRQGRGQRRPRDPNTGGFEADSGLTTVEAIEKDGGTATYVSCDVTKEDQVDNLVAETVRAFGRIDVMVNNANHDSVGGGPIPTRTRAGRSQRPRQVRRRRSLCGTTEAASGLTARTARGCI